MIETTHSPKLILYPDNIYQIPSDIGRIIHALDKLGLLTQPQYRNDTYLPGDNFLNLITFLGCSPSINLAPTADDPFCSIHFSPIEKHAFCLGHSNTIQPKCPHCKKRIDHWHSIDRWQNAETLITCKHCKVESEIHSLKWRQEAGMVAIKLR